MLARILMIRRLSPWSFTAAYAGCLGLVLALLLISHAALLANLHGVQSSARAVDLLRQQQAAAQNIAALVGGEAAGDGASGQRLGPAIREFAATQDQLSALVSGFWGPGPLNGSWQVLGTAAQQFLGDARAVANAPGYSLPRPLASAVPADLALVPLLRDLEALALHYERRTQLRVAGLEALQSILLLAVFLLLALQALGIFLPLIRRLNASSAEIVRLATTDPLTGLANRKGFLERCELEQARALRYFRPLSILMLDADHFKKINDTHGHDAGDIVLKALAKVFNDVLRKTDLAARLGGEEFGILLPETDLPGAAYVAERLRVKIASQPVKAGRKSINVTISIGVTLVPNTADGIDQAMLEADRLMYRAKQSGRNCVVWEAAALPA